MRAAAAASVAVAVLAGVTFSTTASSAQVTELPNASFESVDGDGYPANWVGAEPHGPLATTDRAARTGDRSLEVVNPGGSGVAIRSSEIAAAPGDEFEAAAHLLHEDGDPAWVYLEYWNSADQRIANYRVEPDTSTDWERVNVSAEAPTGTIGVTMLIYGSINGAGVTLVDDAELAPAPEGPYDPAIGTQKQLFHDDYRIDDTDRISRIVHEADKHDESLVVPDKPWESDNVYVYGSVIHDEDDDVYKMWYHAYNREIGDYFTLYATSPDGVTWNKPELGAYEYDGSTENNIVGDMHSPTVVKDQNDPDPQRRYKMLAMEYGAGYGVWFSPDGITWTPSEQNPVLPDGDVANVTYDPYTERFIATTKHPHPAERAAFISYSEDFENWTEPKAVMFGDERDQNLAVANGYINSQIYGMPIIPYEGQYVGLPWVFQFGGAGEPGTAGDGPIDTQIAFSRDGETWQRDDRTPVIPTGIEGSFDSGMTFTAGNVIVQEDEIWMYYGGWNGLHGVQDRQAAIGLATWRLDGFVSLANGGDEPGTVTTKPLVFDGDELRVNADIPQDGGLHVEVLDADGEVIAGFDRDSALRLRGDRIDQPVRWEADPDLGSLAGEEIRLRFHLDGGHLYSYRFVD